MKSQPGAPGGRGAADAEGRRRGRPRSGAREAIVDATRSLLVDKGLARVTTKEVARLAGVSEASIYYHFADKFALLVAVIDEAVPNISGAVSWLSGRVGAGTVRENLEELANRTIHFFTQIEPVEAAARADPEVRDGFRSMMAREGRGPHLGIEAVAAYLAEEQRLGRVNDHANLHGTGELLFGAAYFWAVRQALFGVVPAPAQAFAHQLAETLVAGLRPDVTGGRRDRRGRVRAR